MQRLQNKIASLLAVLMALAKPSRKFSPWSMQTFLSRTSTRLPVKKPSQILRKDTKLENVGVRRNDVLLLEE